MKSLDEAIAESELHNRILRYLHGSASGIADQFLTSSERVALNDLISLGAVRQEGNGLFMALPLSDQTRAVLDRFAAGATSVPKAQIDPQASESNEAVELLSFMQSLNNATYKSSDMIELFQIGFRLLAGKIGFEIGAAIVLEQTLDIHLSRAEGDERVVSESLIEEIRSLLHDQIPVEFIPTDAVVRSDAVVLPRHGSASGAGIPEYRLQTILHQDNRAAGMLVAFRDGEGFTIEEQRLIDIMASQLTMVLGNLRAQSRIQSLADTDELTGIWNKRFFKRQLPGEVDRAHVYNLPLSLLMFDVDNFKEINDTFGHPMGDVVLSELCGLVRESLRQPDYFARFGGDEFAIILPHTDLWGARTVAERIVESVRNLDLFVADNSAHVRTSVSVGIATLSSSDLTAADLTQRADEQLYLAKKSGKNRFTW